jgi:hypothetical protein
LSERGFISISRKIFDNPLLKDADYFRAWVWLICEACWKPARERIQTGRSFAMVDLERGQLSHARSFIANALGMTEQRIRTLLSHLENEGMINRTTNQGQTVITICKYDDYQIAVGPINQGSGGATNQLSTSDQPELNKGNKGIKERGASARPAKDRSMAIPEDFAMDAAMERYAAQHGFAGEIAKRMFGHFCNHHRAKGSRMVSWPSAWRTWVDNQANWNSQRPQRRAGVPDV